jgi:protein O-mannosyl-transferase
MRRRKQHASAVPAVPESAAPPPAVESRTPLVQPWCVGLLLFAVTLILYLTVAGFSFTNLDDPQYISDNPQVLAGLTWAGVKWAFTAPHVGNWIPLAWLSHMLDAQLFGPGPVAPHVGNALIHALNAVLVFWLLRQMTGAFWRSALVAALFALHPLRVESVAWACERRDVLSSMFALLALLAYARYVRWSKANNSRSKAWYGLALAAFAAGLMSKPMVVTLPLLLLLLDYWPLQRFEPDVGPSAFDLRLVWRLVLEKIPFLLLSAGFSAVTVRGQDEIGAMPNLAALPLSARIGGAFVSYGQYLAKTFWPVNLAIPYPYDGNRPVAMMVLAFLLVAGLTLGALVLCRRRPYVGAGWFWFLAGLLPVIGLLQTGNQALADRFTYLPSLGLFVVLVWAGHEGWRRWPAGRPGLAALVAVGLAACAWRSYQQLQYWQNSGTLFKHALAVTRHNFVANYNLASYLKENNQLEEAAKLYRDGLTFMPNEPALLAGLAYIRGNIQGNYPEAVELYRMAVSRAPATPKYWFIHNNYANILARMDSTNAPEMIEQYRRASQLKPDSVSLHETLGLALARSGNLAEAAVQLQAAVRLAPDSPEDHCNLGNAFAGQNQYAAAVREYQTALRLKPDYAHAANNLASVLETMGRPGEALAKYQEAVRLEPGAVITRFNLGNLLAKLGRRDEAVAQFQAVLRLQPGNVQARAQLEQLAASPR